MARRPRHLIPGMPQHLLMRGVNRQAVFFQPSDYARFLKVLDMACREHGGALHAYVLMTNHVHLLVTPDTENSIPLLMQCIGRRYVQWINKRDQRTGHLWQGRYKSALVQDDRYLLTCQRYIELNPVRAGMVEMAGEYRHSSFAANALGIPNALLTPHPTYQALAADDEQRRKCYRDLFRDGLDEPTLQQLRDTTNAGLVLGDKRFKNQVERLSGRSVRLGKRGRPRNN